MLCITNKNTCNVNFIQENLEDSPTEIVQGFASFAHFEGRILISDFMSSAVCHL